jgi:hypothetical protein
MENNEGTLLPRLARRGLRHIQIRAHCGRKSKGVHMAKRTQKPEVQSRAFALLRGVFVAATGAALAWWGRSVPIKIAGAERALAGLEEMRQAFESRKATVDRRKRPGVSPTRINRRRKPK